MTDADLNRWLLAPHDPPWPTEPFWLRPGVLIPDPQHWRSILLTWWEGSERSKANVLADLRQLRAVMAEPIVPRTGIGEAHNDAVWRTNVENERKRREQA